MAGIFELWRHKKHTPEIVVSMTSYPPRINCLQPVLKSIFKQNRKPDKIVLWLATSEFPRQEDDLPVYLVNLAKKNKICIEWCQDLKPHKKYFYALQKYRDSIVITIDDDLLYARDMIKCLMASYQKFPHAVSAMRSHIMHPEGEKFAPYAHFTYQQNEIIGVPSMRLLATNGAGSLFPPHLLDLQYFDERLIERLSLYTDDLWLKTVEVLSKVPVVQPRPFKGLKYVKNSQLIGLFYGNTLHGGNDTNLEKIRNWADSKFGRNVFWEKIFTDSLFGNAVIQPKSVAANTILYFVPHQDDELLTMGIDICAEAQKGNDVHVVLCTDGSKSCVRSQLNNRQKCSMHSDHHHYNLSEQDFISARDAEFIASCRILGVMPENIHILPQRAVDGTLNVDFAEKIIMQYLQQYGADATVASIYFANGKNQHQDHKNLGLAVYHLWQMGLIRQVKFFREPYCIAEKNIKFTAKSASPEIALRVCYASYSYGYWNPDANRYAIGYHSVPQDFENLRRKMKTYYHELHR